ncbi:hypothetical protein ACWGDT_04695 [Streptomyces avermitilis]
MTSEPEGGPEFGPSMSRAEMVAAWRERRHARRSGAPTTDGASGPDGFTLRRWRRAGVFGADAVAVVRGLLQDLLDAGPGEHDRPDWAVETLRRCLDGDPGPQLLPAVSAVIEAADPDRVVALMRVIHEVGLPWLTPIAEQRLHHLLGQAEPELGRDAHPTTSEDESGAFALQHALRNGETGTLSPATIGRLLPWIPMGILDDLIDAGVITRSEGPWRMRTAQRDQWYLLARLSPESVAPRTALTIGWDEAVERLRFLAGEPTDAPEGTLYDLLERATDGDTGVLKDLEQHLPRPLVLRLRHIQDGALTGSWDLGILGDRGLWRLMAALWEPKAAVVPARSEFHALAALRHAYDLISAGDFKKARAQIDKLVDHEEGDPRQLAEAWNMRAYLALLDDDLDNALIALASIADRHPEAASNLELVKRRRGIPRNGRPHPTNPYLELGLPNGSAVWKHRYRDLRRAFADSRDEAARLNRAMRRIQEAEHAEDWSEFFVLPLDQEVFRLPVAPPVTLVPPVEPMPRRTVPADPSDLEVVRRRAVADLLPTLLNAPRRPDHQHRTTS